MGVKDKMTTVTELNWDAEDEIQLFFALDGLRPMGINKHFNMALLVERLSNKLNKDVNSEILWAKLKTMYNLSALDEIESTNFPIETEHFSLPDGYNSSSAEDIIDLEKYEPTNRSETSSVGSGSGTKETESRTRNSTPARQLENNEMSKRTQPKRTRASTSNEVSNSPSTPTPTQTKRRRI